jgi:anti-sigma factor ChrR (cupin superfamily)
MQIHADHAQRVALFTPQIDWVDSPMPGVRRRMLERDGGEVARATSIVAYAPGSSFSSHDHERGEEIFVLDGDFHDEHGTYPAGTYLRNPPGSSHAPGSIGGCTLFVKLRYLAPDDTQRVVVDTRRATWHPGRVDGLSVLPLAEHGTEHTALVRWAPGTRFQAHRHWGGEEILVLEGVFSDEHGDHPAGTWLRSPHLSQHQPYSEAGCLILVKTGHLGGGQAHGTTYS